ncbi:MAG: hypothetical protein M1817_004811 [Caeruleum heppii]|nr:MAG: hypothetical protein M1817_004811 [Caeruleum heppii]
MALEAVFLSKATAFPTFHQNSPQRLEHRALAPRVDPPPVPERPASSGQMSFHGSRFEFIEQTGYEPAVDAMPVLLFSRTTSSFDPCYPESGTVIGSSPSQKNPGTDVPPSANPGQNCNDPGPYTGAYSLGNAFPIYVSARYCGSKDEWRIRYSVYYV